MPPPLRSCDHFRGSPDGAVMLILYGDYQCFHSSQAYKKVNDILNTSAHPFCLVYRHFPRTPPIRLRGKLLRQPRQRRLRVSFGKCMISYINIQRR